MRIFFFLKKRCSGVSLFALLFRAILGDRRFGVPAPEGGSGSIASDIARVLILPLLVLCSFLFFAFVSFLFFVFFLSSLSFFSFFSFLASALGCGATA